MNKQTQETQQLGIQPTDEDLSIYPMVRRSKELRSLIPESSPITFFIHVPKTGGTDLAIKLQDSELYNVFSLDAPEDDYRLQLEWFNPNRPTFIRAHIYILDAWLHFLKGLTNVNIFTVLRNPYSLHVSLGTMIYERGLQEREIAKEPKTAIRFFTVSRNPYSLDVSLGTMIYERDLQEREIAKEPKTAIRAQEEYEKALASILTSTDYNNNYRDIYTRHFAYALENTPLMDRLKVITIDQVDELQKHLLPEGKLLSRPRLNQAKNKLGFSTEDFLNSDLIVILSKLISRKEITLYEQLQAKAGPINWIAGARPNSY